MSNIEMNDCVHPIYDLYASDKDGNIINIVKKKYLKRGINKIMAT